MIPVHVPVTVSATGGRVMAAFTPLMRHRFWYYVMAGEVTAPATLSLHKTSKPSLMKSALKCGLLIIRLIAQSIILLSIASFPM